MLKFIYFDVGGVVIRDFSGTDKWQELKKSIGVKLDFDQEFEEFFGKYEIEACAGRDIETLVPMTKDKFGLKFPKNYSFLADFANRFERNESIWPMIDKLKNKYRIGLLTNMYTKMLDRIYENGLMPHVEWEVVIDSSIVKLQKPQVEIFKLAEEKAGVKAEEILFVENTRRHFEAAERLGWQTLFYDSSDIDQPDEKLKALFN